MAGAMVNCELGEQAKVKETVRLYTKVWKLPTYRGVVGRLMFYAIIFSVLLATMRTAFFLNPNSMQILLGYLLLIGLPALLGTKLLYAMVGGSESPLDSRRTIGIAQYGVLLWLIITFLGGVADFVLAADFYEGRMWLLGLAMAYMLFAFLLTAMSDHHPLRNFVGALMPLIVWMITVMSIAPMVTRLPTYPTAWPIFIVGIFVLCSAVVHYIYRSVSKPFERDLGINGPALLRAFGHDLLMDNPTPFEKIMDEISFQQDMPLEVIVFRNAGNLLAVGVILYVHPGPFRDIGSSGLPSAIIKHVRETHGVHGFVLHGSCTHHQNLTTKEDYGRIMEEIDRLIETTEVHETISGPHWTDEGRFKVWTLFAGNDLLTITTSAPDFTDDIALEVGMDTAKMVRKRLPKIGGVAIVDAHNCIDEDAVSVMPGSKEAGEYVAAVSSAAFTTINNPSSKVSIGIHQLVPSDVSEEEGMGPGGITALVMKFDDREMALLSIDGNNMEPGMREEIISMIKGLGIDDVEAVTTDTHVVNAIARSNRGYSPVGAQKRDEVLSSIAVAITKAIENTLPVSVGLGFGEVKAIRTYGEKGFDILTQNIVEAYDIAKKTGTRAALVGFLGSLLLAFLL
jgi:putative membrane protein